MSTSLLPPHRTDTHGQDAGTPARPDPPDDRRPPRRSPGRRFLAVTLTTAALLGGTAGAGVVALTGERDGDGSATTATAVQSSTSHTTDTSSTSLDASAVYASVLAGVVEIAATGTSSSSAGPMGQGSSESTATGSGFVVDANGHIITAAHVVDNATSIKVTFADGTTRTATLTGKDDATDVAVLKVDPSGLTLHPLKLGRSASLDVGDAVAAIGSPFGYEESLSTGIVSGLDRTIEAPNGFTVAHAIQTDAALNPGNSGGPIVDSSGRVIGIADQIATNGSSEQSSGVGFAVPIDLIESELADLEAGRTVTHAYLGVSTTESTRTRGAVVASVTAGAPASAAGLKAGDVVTTIDGKQISGSGDLVSAIAGHDPGDRITITVRRDSDTRTLTATLATQPEKQAR
jgi:putative serine protease PepD